MKYNELIQLKTTNNIVNDACEIINTAQYSTHYAINIALVWRNWLLGKRIAEEELKYADGTKYYGAKVIANLSKELVIKYGKGFNKTNLYSFYSFYKLYPNIFHTAYGKSEVLLSDIFHAVRGKSFEILSWTHYRILIQVKDDDARNWYEKEAIRETWGYRTLQRNISSQYYYRLLKSQVKQPVIDEMKKLTKDYQNNKLEFIKNPIVVEFLGLKSDPSFSETKLESSIITNLKDFLMELGKGYAFIARQQHIHTEKQDYYIDLVFYNYILKCFVLVDLKTSKITHQDVGQMDMYIRMYDEFKRGKDDNPTLGIILCSDTDEDIVRYSVMHGNEQLFASKYKLYLPTEEELRAEIEAQKTVFDLQKENEEN